jgi:hypothetical protein
MTTRLTALLVLLAVVGCGRTKSSNNIKPITENIFTVKVDIKGSLYFKSIFDLNPIPPAMPDDELKSFTAAERKTQILLTSLANLSLIELASRAALERRIGYANRPEAIALQTEVNSLVDVHDVIVQIREDIYKHSEYKEPELSEIRHDELDHLSLNARIQQVIRSLGKIKAAIAQLDESQRERR